MSDRLLFECLPRVVTVVSVFTLEVDVCWRTPLRCMSDRLLSQCLPCVVTVVSVFTPEVDVSAGERHFAVCRTDCCLSVYHVL